VSAPCTVVIHGFNKVNIAFMPAEEGPGLTDQLREIHAYEKIYADTLEAGLSIVNPCVHTGPCLFSVTAIENWPKRPFFLYEHGVTPASCRVNLQIDNERKEIGPPARRRFAAAMPRRAPPDTPVDRRSVCPGSPEGSGGEAPPQTSRGSRRMPDGPPARLS
jgi:hypothetical protein